MSVNEYFSSAYKKATEEEKMKNNRLVMVLFARAIDAATALSYEDSGDKIYQAMLKYAKPLLDAGWEWALSPSGLNYRGIRYDECHLDKILTLFRNQKMFRTGAQRLIGMINWKDGRILLARTSFTIKNSYEVELVSMFEGRSWALQAGYADYQDYTVAPKGSRVTLAENLDLDQLVSKLYGFEVSVSYANSAKNSLSALETFLNVTHFFGNGMEEVLRLTSNQEFPWLYNIFAEGVYPGRPCESGNLKKLLKINKNDLKYFLAQEDPDRLLFFMLARQKNNCSVSEAMKAYDRVIKINDKYELDDEYDYWARERSGKNIRIYGDRGRRILAAKALPICLRFYSSKRLSKVISVNKYLRYLIDERKKNEDVQLSELETDLEDYNRMLKEVMPAAATRFELPYNIVNAHNTMVTNYNAVKAEGGADVDTPENVEKLCRNYNDFWNTYSDDKFFVKRPLVPSEIHREGAELCHCVGTYTRRVLSGDTHIFFVRRKAFPDKPLVTLEVSDDGRILQQRGKGNRMTTDEESAFISNWIREYHDNLVDWKATGKHRKNVFSEEAEAIIKKMKENKVTAADKIREQLQEVKYLDEETGAEL